MRASWLNAPNPLLLMVGLMLQVVCSFSPPKALGRNALHAHDSIRPVRASPRRAPLLCPHGVRHQLKLTTLLSGMSHFEQNNFEIAFEADGKVLDDGGRDEGDESLCLLERYVASVRSCSFSDAAAFSGRSCSRPTKRRRALKGS